MKSIKLTNCDKYAIIDDDDFPKYNKFIWYIDAYGYAIGGRGFVDHNGVTLRRGITMHRLINKTPSGMDTDHINRDKLDNRKCNLRTVSHYENMLNCGLRKTNKSGYKNISWEKGTDKWRFSITHRNINSGKKYHIGLYKTIADAVSARNKWAKENKIEEIYP